MPNCSLTEYFLFFHVVQNFLIFLEFFYRHSFSGCRLSVNKLRIGKLMFVAYFLLVDDNEALFLHILFSCFLFFATTTHSNKTVHSFSALSLLYLSNILFSQNSQNQLPRIAALILRVIFCKCKCLGN